MKIVNILNEHFQTREKLFLFFFSCLFSFGQVIGYSYSQYEVFQFSIFQFVLILVLTYIVVCFLYSFLQIYNHRKETKFMYLLNSKHSTFILMLLFSLVWLFPLLVFYPSNFSYDAGTQLRMFSYGVITQYHPVIHTVLLGGLAEIGKQLFDSYQIGLALYSILQMLFMAFCFSKLLLFLNQKKVSGKIIGCLLFLFLFLPIHSIFALTTTKDVIFSGLFLLTTIQIIELTTNTEQYFKEKKNLISLIFLFFFLLTFRNNMFYAYLLWLPFFLFYFRKYWKSIIMITISTFLLYGGYHFALTKVFQIPNGPRVEMFSVIIQQLSRVYHKADLTLEEKQKIESLFSSDSLEHYHPRIADPVKSGFQSQVFLNNFKSYFSLYINLGIQNPNIYIDSFINNTYSYFYIGDPLPDKGARTYLEFSCLEQTNLTRTENCSSFFPSWRKKYQDLLQQADYQKIPILSLFLNFSLPIWILFFSMMVLIIRKEYSLLIPLLFSVTLLFTNLLGPVVLFRYAYPFFICAPLYLYIAFWKNNSVNQKWLT